MVYQLIDTEGALRSALNRLKGHPNEPPSYYIDTEGHKLGRSGTLDLLQLHVLPLQETLVIDIYTLQQKAFNTSSQGLSLKMLLESSSIAKVFFDVRSDSDALFSHYEILLEGVVDLQMMEYFQPGRGGRHLRGLKDCITQDSGLMPEEIQDWSLTKDSVVESFSTVATPQNYLSQLRPLPDILLTYSVGDVKHLPHLYEIYRQCLSKQVWNLVRKESQKRLQQSRQSAYDPDSKRKWKGPFRLTNFASSNSRTQKNDGTKSKTKKGSQSHDGRNSSQVTEKELSPADTALPTRLPLRTQDLKLSGASSRAPNEEVCLSSNLAS